jgi:hypothetical protein
MCSLLLISEYLTIHPSLGAVTRSFQLTQALGIGNTSGPVTQNKRRARYIPVAVKQ